MFILGALSVQVVGAIWYLLLIERQTTCWRSECRQETGSINVTKCSIEYLDCESRNQIFRQIWAQNTSVFQNCNPNNDISFNFGIFQVALTKHVPSTNFNDKYFYSLWWGLQQFWYVLHPPWISYIHFRDCIYFVLMPMVVKLWEVKEKPFVLIIR